LGQIPFSKRACLHDATDKSGSHDIEELNDRVLEQVAIATELHAYAA
jgi:hypothetical protein